MTFGSVPRRSAPCVTMTTQKAHKSTDPAEPQRDVLYVFPVIFWWGAGPATILSLGVRPHKHETLLAPRPLAPSAPGTACGPPPRKDR